MPKKSGKRYGPTFAQYVETYIAERDVCETYANVLRARCRDYIVSTGRDIRVSELKCSDVNAYLSTLKDRLKPQKISAAILKNWPATGFRMMQSFTPSLTT